MCAMGLGTKKMKVGTLFVSAGLSAILTFALLAAALTTDYWYIVKVDPVGSNGSHPLGEEELDSHSGLWRTCEGKNACILLIDPFGQQNVTASLQHLLSMHRTFVVLLPLSLILVVFGGMCGLVSSLAKSFHLLLFSGSFFLIGSLLTMSGICVYISYSNAAFEATMQIYESSAFQQVHISFGWSMVLAWLSFTTEVFTGTVLLIAAKIVKQQQAMRSAAI
ncbi:transmembrane protein 235 [Protopterus annectens]|uniref:transmembrane protein 235 n=1 Tax=Protopterus annectens TaxID=7888 RepID=UPI001CFA391C|nr:transmembrane protein 235 [Protopterus annectens]